MKICSIAIDIANNKSAIGTKLYEVKTDENGQEVSRTYIPGTTRLWMDQSARALNSALTPSVILYQSKNKGMLEKDCCGWDAMEALKNPTLNLSACSDIKYKFFIDRQKFGENAENFKYMIRYLLDCVQPEQEWNPDGYEISISYPVICNDSDMGFLENIIGEVWYDLNKTKPLVKTSMIDEAECAFRFALTDGEIVSALLKLLEQQATVNVLAVDIGGSTMELCLYGITEENSEAKHHRIRMLRADDPAGRGLGGRKMDNMLLTKLNGMGILDPVKIHQIDKDLLMLRYFTPLKEDLNERLKAGQPARLDSLYSICNYQKLQLNSSVSKETFVEWCKGYTATICEQIQELCSSAEMNTDQIDLVLLTGGGCELFPVENAIANLMKPDTPMLRPGDPSGVLDYPMAEADHPDYINGLCPRAEVASLACVLGNLAEPVQLKTSGTRSKAKKFYSQMPVFKELFEQIQQKAEAGDSVSQNILGFFYHFGIGVEPDLDIAYQWYRSSAAFGNEDAAVNVQYFEDRQLIPSDEDDKKQMWLWEMAGIGNADFNYRLGDSHDPEYRRFFHDWYDHLAKDRDADALFIMGCCYENNIYHPPRQLKPAYDPYEDSYYYYDTMGGGGYYSPSVSMKQDPVTGESYPIDSRPTIDILREMAFRYYEQASRLGVLAATYKLGYCYEHGIGCTKDMDKANQYYAEAPNPYEIPPFTPPESVPVEIKNRYETQMDPYRWCEECFINWKNVTKRYNCSSYCKCDQVCVEYTCQCDTECYCDDDCGSDCDDCGDDCVIWCRID